MPTIRKVRRVAKTAAVKKISEAELLKYALDLLARSPLVHWRMPVSGVPQSIGKKMIMKKSPVSGFPDVCGLTKHGIFFGMEIKTLKGVVADNQKKVHAMLRSSNAYVVVVRSHEDIRIFVEAMKSNQN
jgi:hypothetical protein